MKKIKIITVSLLIFLLVFLPIAAEAHGHGGGGIFWGFGAGLLTGFLFAPRPVYVAPPVYVEPAPVVVYPPYRNYVPESLPPDPPVSGYTIQQNVAPPPTAQSQCREWRMIDRHLEDRWDSYYGKWRQVPVEKWGWVEVPCNN